MIRTGRLGNGSCAGSDVELWVAGCDRGGEGAFVDSTVDGGEATGGSTGPERKNIAVATPAPNTAANLTAEPKADMAKRLRNLQSGLPHTVPSAVRISHCAVETNGAYEFRLKGKLRAP